MSTSPDQAARWARYRHVIDEAHDLMSESEIPWPEDGQVDLPRYLLITRCDNDAWGSLHETREQAIADAQQQLSADGRPFVARCLIDLDTDQVLPLSFLAVIPVAPNAPMTIGPDTLGPQDSFAVAACGLTITLAHSNEDGKLVVFIDTDSDRHGEVPSTTPDGREVPASEQGPDLRIRLNDWLIHGRHLRDPVDVMDMPSYAPAQIAALNTGVTPAPQDPAGPAA